MIATLKERKITLLDHIEQLKREIDILERLEDQELALCRHTGGVRYISVDRPGERSGN